MTLSISISQAIVAAQLFLLLVTVLLSYMAQGHKMARFAAWASSVFAVGAIGVAVLAIGKFVAIGIDETPNSYLIYAIVAIAVAIVTWLATVVVAQLAAQRYQKRLQSGKVVNRAGDELRSILRQEGIDLDARLQHAEGEREQFLYALEERHAAQIAGLAQEYQHEARTILTQLLDELAAERLQPLVEERLAQHSEQIEQELGQLDVAAGGEALSSLRSEHAELLAQIESAEQRVAKLQAENPDKSVEEKLPERLAAIDGQIAERTEAIKAELTAKMVETTAEIEARIADVGSLLDEKIDAAGSPLAARMAETEKRVELRLGRYDETLDKRFVETETVLNGRVAEQEQALEARVLDVERQIDEKIAAHLTGVEGVLARHDEQLQSALTVQQEAVLDQLVAERDRILADMTERLNVLQTEITGELTTAEDRARQTVEATQDAWNSFTEELEERFAITREEAMKAAQEIAHAERHQLELGLAESVQAASADIQEKVEALGREAAWQRAQVERTVEESLDMLKATAREAVDNADTIFGDLERIGAERVEKIRRQAEDALVQSRDYVEQLQTSLSAHLDELRDRSEVLAAGMNERLAAITTSADSASRHVEQLSRDVVESASRELNAVSEQQLHALAQRLSEDVATSVQRAMADQQRAFELHISELANRMSQQAQGDLAGMADHARAAVSGELERVMHQTREQAMQAQSEGARQLMSEIQRQQDELAERSRDAVGQTRALLEGGLRDSRRQLEEAMASMGAHMREELVRFSDEGQRKVQQIIQQLQSREQDLLRDEDRRLSTARNELVRQHQGALESQVKNMVGGLSSAIGTGSSTFSAQVADVSRPATPLSSPSPEPFGSTAGSGSPFGANPFGV